MRFICLSFFTLMGLSINAQEPLNVMTFNIRYNNPGDSLNAWPLRADKVSGQILFHEAHIVGVQEALHGQMQDMAKALPAFKYTGVARDDGAEKGEYSAIFYDTTRLRLLESQTFWLSETPTVPGSKSWDAAITRIVTWAKFTDKKTRKTFYHFNTHFDHIGKVARAESAKILLKKVREVAKNEPCIITGDFNAHPSDEPIKIIVNAADPLHFTDAKSISLAPHYGPTGTANAFRSKETSNDPIDYIFITKKIRVLKHATLSQTWQGRFSSDHFPVFARVVIE